MFIIACALSGISEFAVWIPAKHPSIAIGFAIMFGFSSGAFIALLGALAMSVSPIPEIGYRMGVVFLATSIPALTMGPIGGAILQNPANGWLNLKIFAGVMSLAGSVIVVGVEDALHREETAQSFLSVKGTLIRSLETGEEGRGVSGVTQ